MTYRYYAELMDDGELWQVGYENAEKTKSHVIIVKHLPEGKARKLVAKLQEAADKDALQRSASREPRRTNG
jgi:hypothetical protein